MKHAIKHLIRPGIIAACVLIPPVLADRGWWFIGNTYGVGSEPFELLGLFVTLAVLTYWFVVLRREDKSLDTVVPPLVVGAIVLHFLYVYVNYTAMTYDYTSYEAAARNMTTDADPYDRTHYLYPPLLAQCMAWALTFISGSRIYAHEHLTALNTLFYMYQAAQLALIYLVAEQFFALGRALRIPVLYVGILAVVLFFVDAPLFRTVKNQQMNLVVLLAVTFAFAHLNVRALWSGLLMAIAVQLKPQGLLFPAVWLVTGHRKAFVTFIVASAGLILLQTAYDGDWTHWQQFFASLKLFPKYNDYFRNGSLFSLFATIGKILHVDVDKGNLMLFVRICYVAIVAWFGFRYVEREKLYRSGVGKVAAADRGYYETAMRTCAHGADIILLTLLVSPLVWEHHYVLVMPVAVWLFALTRGRLSPIALIAFVLILTPSTFDVGLLSYHRLVGVGLLAWKLTPRHIFSWSTESQKRTYIGLSTPQG